MNSSNGTPLVTIVTPSFQQGEFLEACILSVLNQGYPRTEYMVIDGGSTDGSLEIIQRYSDYLAYWESQSDRGPAQAINKGLERARGQILGWLNSDDVLKPGTVQRVVQVFQERQDVDVVYGRLERIDTRSRTIPTPVLPKDMVDFSPTTAIGECIVNQPGSFWRRSLLDRVGYLREDLSYVFDYEYWVRILLAGGKFIHLPEVMAEFRLSPHSKTVGQTAQAAREHLEVINEILAREDLVERLGLPAEAIWRQARKGRSIVEMVAFYGCVKERRWLEAAGWFVRAHISNPLVSLNRRWLDLAIARLAR